MKDLLLAGTHGALQVDVGANEVPGDVAVVEIEFDHVGKGDFGARCWRF